MNKKQVSYKLTIRINPNWFAIIKILFPNLKDNQEINNFIEKLNKDSKLKVLKQGGLLWKHFKFIQFNDEVSGIIQIWDDHNKTFIDELEISGKIIETEGESIHQRFPKNDIWYPFIITPSEIGFDNIMVGPRSITKTIAKFPYHETIELLLKIGENIDQFNTPMFAIKKFPPLLEAELEKNNIKYETLYRKWDETDFKKELIESPWAQENNIEIYEEELLEHRFTSPYYSIGITVKIFNELD